MTGKVTTIAEGLISPTGVAVAANGDVYVAQLFPGQISKVGRRHRARPTEGRVPAAVEVTPTGLLATINSVPMGKKPKGQVITVTP